MNPPALRELRLLLSALCDEELTRPQLMRLEELLRADAECRREYLRYMDVHARLFTHPTLGGPVPVAEDVAYAPTESAASSASPTTQNPVRAGSVSGGARSVAYAAGSDRDGPGKPASQGLRYALVAVLTLAASVLIQVFWTQPTQPGAGPPKGVETQGPASPVDDVATLTESVGCVWEEPAQWAVGARLAPGELRLRAGVVRVRFDGGPSVLVEGPAVLRLESGTAASVLRGKVVFRADETAAPFDLYTPASVLLHVGTEYAVAVGTQGEEVHVFEGEVRRTPRAAGAPVEPEYLTAGEARRYAPGKPAAGVPAPFDPARFVRRLPASERKAPDPAAGLLAYEGFDYQEPDALGTGRANSGTGWQGPWVAGPVPPSFKGERPRPALNVNESLTRPGGSARGGCFEQAGFATYRRRLTNPVRLTDDGVYYLSFLFRRHQSAPGPFNVVIVSLRTDEELRRKREDPRARLNIGLGNANHLFAHLQGVGYCRPLPLNYDESYLVVAKVLASASGRDQLFTRVYSREEVVDRDEPDSWSAVGPPSRCDLVFDWLELHVNSRSRQAIDEFRLGTTWSAVTAPWASPATAEKDGAP